MHLCYTIDIGEYEVVISSIPLAEIANCSSEKFEKLAYYISQLDYIEYDGDNDEVDDLAQLKEGN